MSSKLPLIENVAGQSSMLYAQGTTMRKKCSIQKQSISGSDGGNIQVKIATMEIQQATQIDGFRAFKVFNIARGLMTSTDLRKASKCLSSWSPEVSEWALTTTSLWARTTPGVFQLSIGLNHQRDELSKS
jgi:hypothetical protein